LSLALFCGTWSWAAESSFFLLAFVNIGPGVPGDGGLVAARCLYAGWGFAPRRRRRWRCLGERIAAAAGPCSGG